MHPPVRNFGLGNENFGPGNSLARIDYFLCPSAAVICGGRVEDAALRHAKGANFDNAPFLPPSPNRCNGRLLIVTEVASAPKIRLSRGHSVAPK